MLTETYVVECVAAWLERQGFSIEQKRIDTTPGDDIVASSASGMKLYVECKGAVSQSGKNLDLWRCSAYAVLGAVWDTERRRPNDLHAIAVPDIDKYRDLFTDLQDFLHRQRITLLLVSADGAIDVWPAHVWLNRDT